MEQDQLKILVVDDEETIRINLEAFLEDEGFRVSSAGTGEEAVKLLASGEFDAAIMDIRLPDMDGNTLLLEAHKRHPRMKFLIHTGSLNYKLPPALLAVGICPEQVHVKPVLDMQNLVDAICQLTDESGSCGGTPEAG